MNLVAVWRAHQLDAILRGCRQSGVVLGGESAGSLCWHAGGTTDSFGPKPQADDGLGFLSHSTPEWPTGCPQGARLTFATCAWRRPTVERREEAGRPHALDPSGESPSLADHPSRRHSRPIPTKALATAAWWRDDPPRPQLRAPPPPTKEPPRPSTRGLTPEGLPPEPRPRPSSR
ncbi:Type 1 glutamine amidotransferase-like domain-containing protein [Phytomonospora sp. NPDC050363]|uniref:Type 1 glutamine amidotransferase-like domain-containing protein n=1 Tax=Phytomonospora sp. NPDC050363 TaxID=3155642 RepID=UPI0033F8B767